MTSPEIADEYLTVTSPQSSQITRSKPREITEIEFSCEHATPLGLTLGSANKLYASRRIVPDQTDRLFDHGKHQNSVFGQGLDIASPIRVRIGVAAHNAGYGRLVWRIERTINL